MRFFFLWLVFGLNAAAGPWTDAVRAAECKQLEKLKSKLVEAIFVLEQSCRGAVLDQSDRCRGVDLAEALGEISVRAGECRRGQTDFPWL